MTLQEYLDAMGILACNTNPYLPALDDFGFTWSDMTALVDRQGLFLCKAYRRRTVYLSPRVYALLRQCRERKTMPPDAELLYDLLRSGPMETAELKRLSLLEEKRYNKAFDFLLEQLYVTAVGNGTVLNPHWSTLCYGTAEQWVALAAPQPSSTDSEGELRAILGRTMSEKEAERLIYP